MKSKYFVGAVLLLVATLVFGSIATPVSAAEIDEDGHVGKGEVIADDLLLTGNLVSMDGTVEGNLLAAGQEVSIGGTVKGDVLVGSSRMVLLPGAKIEGNLFVGAQSVIIAGQVKGSVFSGSAYISVRDGGVIAGNLYSGSAGLALEDGSKVGMDVFAGAAQASFAGNVARDVRIGTGAARVDGSIGRNLVVDLGGDQSGDVTMPSRYFMPDVPAEDIPVNVSGGLYVSESAKIGGKLEYTSALDHANRIMAEPANGVVHNTPTPNDINGGWQDTAKDTGFTVKTVKNWIWHNTQMFLSLILLGLLAAWLYVEPLKNCANKGKSDIWKQFWLGLLIIPSVYLGSIAVFVAIVLVTLVLWLVTLGGLGWTVFSALSMSLVLAMTLFGLLIKYGTAIIAVWVIGDFLREKLFPNSGKFLAILLGVVVFSIFASIPVVGWLFKAFVALVGIGTMWTMTIGKKGSAGSNEDDAVVIES